MKLTSKELKRQARETLTGNYGLPMGAFIVTELIIMAVNMPFNLSTQFNPNNTQIMISMLASIIISLLSIVLSSGLLYIHLGMARKQEVQFSDLFYFFSHRPDRFILSGLLLMGIVFLLMIPATLLTIYAIFANDSAWFMAMAVVWIFTCIVLVPFSYALHLIYFLLIDQPDMKLTHVFAESARLMKGNKWRAFYIGLSFLGMSILAILSLGIGLLWVGPYMNQTTVEFYRNVIGEI